MKNATQLNQKQREDFREALRSLYKDADKHLDEASADARKTALQKLIVHQGTKELVAKYKSLKSKLAETEKLLETKGFEEYGDDVRLDYSAPDNVKLLFETFVEEQIGPEKERVAKLSQAVRDAWSIGTLTEAKQLLESFKE